MGSKLLDVIMKAQQNETKASLGSFLALLSVFYVTMLIFISLTGKRGKRRQTRPSKMQRWLIVNGVDIILTY